MLPRPPYKLFTMPFASEKGARNIIERADEVDIGRANLAEGFPECTQKPLNLGGVAPNRMDFNGIFNMLSAFAFWQQSGGLFTFSAKLDYVPPSIVYFEGSLWWCKARSGPQVMDDNGDPVGAKKPGAEGSENYWEAFSSVIGRELGLLGEKRLVINGDAAGIAEFELKDKTITITTKVGELTGAKVLKVTGDAQGTAQYTLANNIIELNLNVPALRAARLLKLDGDVKGSASWQIVKDNDDGSVQLSPPVTLATNAPILSESRKLVLSGDATGTGAYTLRSKTITVQTRVAALSKFSQARTFRLTGDVTGSSGYTQDDTEVVIKTTDANKTARKTLTLTGDITGSTTFTLGGSSISVKTNGAPLLAKVPDPVPVGNISAFASSTAPSGYLVCDGRSFSASTYPKLYRALGKSVTPDLRGQFLRGVGGNSGAILKVQEDAGRNITGTIMGERPGWLAKSTSGAFYGEGKAGYSGLGDMDSDNERIAFSAARCWGNAHTANEFRPTNVAVLYCIKHD